MTARAAMPRTLDSLVVVCRGVDGTDVFHRDALCPALTARRGWLGYLERVKLRKVRNLRPCRRCMPRQVAPTTR